MRYALPVKTIAPTRLLIVLIAGSVTASAAPARAQSSGDKAWLEISGYAPSLLADR